MAIQQMRSIKKKNDKAYISYKYIFSFVIVFWGGFFGSSRPDSR